MFLCDRSWMALSCRYKHRLPLAERVNLFRGKLIIGIHITVAQPPLRAVTPWEEILPASEAHRVKLAAADLRDFVALILMVLNIKSSRIGAVLLFSEAKSTIYTGSPRIHLLVNGESQRMSRPHSYRNQGLRELRKYNRYWFRRDLGLISVVIIALLFYLVFWQSLFQQLR